MTIFIITIVMVLSISFLSSLFEAVILSVTPAYAAVLVKEKKRAGVLLEHLIEKLDRPLTAILTMNTIANTMGSAAIAYQTQTLFGETWITLSSMILTIAILVFSEIVPKSFGAGHWKALAPYVAYGVQIYIISLYPLVVTFELIGKMIRKTDNPEVSREEMIMTAEIGAEEGTLKNKESLIIKNLLMLDKIYVADIMTPRSVFFSLEASMTVEEVVAQFKPIRFSRVPVYKESLDNIVGMTHRYKILEALSHDEHDKQIGDLLTPIPTLSERMTVSHALDYFIKEKSHLALALDEYGVITGLVTLEDAVETLLGVEIMDEFDNVEDMRKYALEQWSLRKQKIRRS